MSKNTPLTLQKVKDEQARLQPLEARAGELRDAIERAKGEVADLDAAIRQPQESDARATVRALALGSTPLESIAAQESLSEERRTVLRQRRDQADQRRRILEAALQENAVEQDAVRKAVDSAKRAHFELLYDAVFSSDAMHECRRQLVELYGAACAAGNTSTWWDWLAVAVTGWGLPTDEEHAAAINRFAGE